MTEIRGKKTLITGAAMGMGKLMAERFADAGAEVILVDINEAELERTTRALKLRGHGVHSFVCDLTDRAAISTLKDAVEASAGRIDILINNAGVVFGGKLEDISDREDDLTVGVNMEALHWMTKAFIHDIKSSFEGHIVQMASAAGLLGIPYQVMYSASKWFVIGYAEALRMELKQEKMDHVHTTIVCPSLVNTGMFEGSKAPLLAPILEPEDVVDRIVDAVRDNTLYVKAPWMVKLTPVLRELLPTSVVDTLSEALGATDLMHGFKGRGDE